MLACDKGEVGWERVAWRRSGRGKGVQPRYLGSSFGSVRCQTAPSWDELMHQYVFRIIHIALRLTFATS